MPVIGRLCFQFSGLLRSRSSSVLLPPPFQSEHRVLWNVCPRLYSRKANAARRAIKAAQRAQAKQERKVFKTVKIIKPFPIDKCADKKPSTDNVWFQHMHPFNQLTFEEAISYHRESVHETVYNDPGAFVNVVAVLNLQTRKQNTTLDKIKGSFMPTHLYPSGNDVRILAICKERVDIEEALEAGAFTAGGLDLIQSIEEGKVQVEEYDLVVAHSDILPNLAPIRGLMKTKMPKANLGTLGRDMAELITKAKESRSYNLICDSEDKNIGWVDDTVGKLNMPYDHLRENFYVFLSGILKQQPRVENLPFVKDLYVRCSATDEVFLLNCSTVVKEETRELPGSKKETFQLLLAENEEEHVKE